MLFSIRPIRKAYFAHYKNIRSHLTIEDFARVDAMIALRMRANGHPSEAVLAAIRDCAPQIRIGTKKRRNWPAYAERTMNYAFGFAGDRDLQRNARYLELWKRIENPAFRDTQAMVLRNRVFMEFHSAGLCRAKCD